MASLRSYQIFAVGMLLAFLAAFFLPNRVSDRGRGHVQILFAPVALPTRWVTGFLHDAVWPARATDDASPRAPRETDAVYRENEELRVRLANLGAQLEHYKARAAERDALGEVRDRCSRYTVMGGDSGPRDTIMLAAGGSLQLGMVALTRQCIVGRVERVGAGGALVQLLTDKNSKFTGSFGRYETNAAGAVEFRRFDLPATLIQGTGDGGMRSGLLDLKMVETAGLQQDDWLVLDDTSWPEALRGYRVGRVSSVKSSGQNMLIAEVTIHPGVDGQQLRDVMVMDK